MVGNTSGNSNDQPNTVWTNDGSGTFTNSGQVLGNSKSRSVALGDLDGDGDLDAMVANFNQPNTVWLGDGSGNFHQLRPLALGNSWSWSVALGDLDGDGDLDAMVANNGNHNTVWLGDGTGTFTNSGQELGNSYSLSVALGDLDGDGDLDAMVANGGWMGKQPNTVWTNDRDRRGMLCLRAIWLGVSSNGHLSDSCVIHRRESTFGNGSCSDTICPEPTATGACCVDEVAARSNTETACTELGGTWTEGGACDDCPDSCAGDTNGDGVIDIFDLLNMLSDWGTCP